MHILILTQYYAPEIGAAQTRLRSTANCLKELGHEVTVLTAMPNHLQDSVMPEYRGKLFVDEELDEIRVLRTWVYAATGRSWKRLANYFSFVATSILAAAKVPKVDLIFFESPPLFLGLSAVALARKSNARLAMNISDLWPDSVKAIAPGSSFSKGPLYTAAEQLEKWLYKRCDIVTAVTPGIEEALLTTKGLPPHKVAFLPNGIDPLLFAPRAANESSKSPYIFLTIGSHGYAHGMEVILEAASLLRHRSDIHFRFVGDGSVKTQLVEKAKQMQLPNVVFANAVPLTEVPNEIAASTATLVTLRDAPFYDRTRPARTFPSLACARPVIFSGRGDFAKMIEEVGCGTTTLPGNAQELANAVSSYVDNPKKVQAQGEAGSRYTHANYKWPTLVDRWLEKAMI